MHSHFVPGHFCEARLLVLSSTLEYIQYILVALLYIIYYMSLSEVMSEV